MIQCYQAALEIYSKGKYPKAYCKIIANLGMVMIEIDEKEGCNYIQEALSLNEFLPDQGKTLEKIYKENCKTYEK